MSRLFNTCCDAVFHGFSRGLVLSYILVCLLSLSTSTHFLFPHHLPRHNAFYLQIVLPLRVRPFKTVLILHTFSNTLRGNYLTAEPVTTVTKPGVFNETSSCVCGVWSRYFRTKHDLFQTLTKCFLRLNLIRHLNRNQPKSSCNMKKFKWFCVTLLLIYKTGSLSI